jgi:hypothetical protein
MHLILVAALAVAAEPAATGRFAVSIEQDGKPVAVKDHEATLRKAPFDILVDLPGKGSFVYVNTSFADAMYEKAKTNKPLGREFRPGLFMAEGDRNAEKDIIPGPDAIHSWYYETDQDNRFNEVKPSGAGFRGRRTVANAYLDGKDVKVEDWKDSTLYLVFLSGEGKPDASETVERQREYLKLKLKK